jgi:uncharacterized protein (TIGR00251 family)
MLSDHPDGLLMDVRVQPKSSQNALVGIHDNSIKIKLNAPPVEGKANKALIQLVAKLLRCPKSSVTIIAGQASRNKRVLVRIEKGPDFEDKRQSMKNKIKARL